MTLSYLRRFECWNPLYEPALEAIDREGDSNPDAAALFERLMRVNYSAMLMLEACNHFDGSVKSRPRLMCVLLRELADIFPRMHGIQEPI